MKELKNEFLLILFGILLIINLIILIKSIKIISNYKKTEKNEQPKPINLPLSKSISNSELWDDLYGSFYPNILYSNGNNIIINTYGKNGINYNNLVLILKIQASISSKILYILDFLLFSDNKV